MNNEETTYEELPGDFRSILETAREGDGPNGHLIFFGGCNPSRYPIRLFLFIAFGTVVFMLLSGGDDSWASLPVTLVIFLTGFFYLLIRRHFKRLTTKSLRQCVFFDGQTFCLIHSGKVRRWPVAMIKQIDVIETFHVDRRWKDYKKYSLSDPVLEFIDGSTLQMPTFEDQGKGRRIRNTFNQLQGFVRALPPEHQNASGRNLFNAWVKFRKSGGKKVDVARLTAPAPEIPPPKPDPPPPLPRFSWVGFVVLVLACLTLYLTGPSVQRYATEELHFRRLDPKAFSVKNGQHYLHKYPEGRHVVQVRSWMDDVAFSSAKKSLQVDNDPEPLRAYMDEHINHYLKAQTLLHDAGALTP